MLSITGVEDVTVTEGTIIFDIRFFAIVPKGGEHINLIINVEAQNNFYPGYPLIKRRLHYCSRMISSQYGPVFTKSHYEKVKKVYSIWICMNLPKFRMELVPFRRIKMDFAFVKKVLVIMHRLPVLDHRVHLLVVFEQHVGHRCFLTTRGAF